MSKHMIPTSTELRRLSVEEAKAKLEEVQTELFHTKAIMRQEKGMVFEKGQPGQLGRYKALKKLRARLLTIVKETELAN